MSVRDNEPKIMNLQVLLTIYLHFTLFEVLYMHIVWEGSQLCPPTGDCYRIVLDGRSNRPAQYFVPKSSTVCFDCIAYEPIEVRGSLLPRVLWLLNGQNLSNNDHFANGHVMSNGTLMVTNSSKSFDLSSITTLGCANNLDDIGNNMQQAIIDFQIILGGEDSVNCILC